MADYPSDDELERVRTWPTASNADLLAWFAYIRSIGNYWPSPDPWGWTEGDVLGGPLENRPVRRFEISTGGWSGNEDILEAMRGHRTNWIMTWHTSRNGGHFTFEVPLDGPEGLP